MTNRYAVVEGTFARQIVLLKGKPCSYGKCKFCNYTLDNDLDTEKCIKFNHEILKNVTNDSCILEVINSGNVFDLPKETLAQIKDICIKKEIKILYFESYLNELKNFAEIRNYFNMVEIRFRIGLETYDDRFRKVLGKGFIVANQIDRLKANYYSACLMVCIKGQTRDQILNDLTQVQKDFTTATINVFVTNGTGFETDFKLKEWFLKEIYPTIKDNPQLEILVDNKDLGVFEQ